jgi:hypothetical protein
MYRKAHQFVSFILALCALMGEAHAQATANGPYYANPSWDQKLQCDTISTCPRFIVLANWNNEAVLDRETGLVWEKTVDATNRDENEGTVYCANKVVGGRKGWRLPALHELTSLVDTTRSFPALPAGHPFAGQLTGAHWSSTIDKSQTLSDGTTVPLGTFFFFVNFDGGDVHNAYNTGSQFPWCVRGPLGAPIQ